MAARFPTTQWSRVVAAGAESEVRASAALSWLCESYWYPLYVFVRRKGYGPDDASDLTQGFFAYLLENDVIRAVDPGEGRFRAFLLVALKNYLSHERERSRAQKRGGAARTISLDGETAERRYREEPADRLTPEEAFQRRWALTILERSLERLERRYSQAGRMERYRRLERYLRGEKPSPPYGEVARELGMTEVAVRAAVRRLRQQLGRTLRDEIAETVASPDEVDDEVRYLLGVVSPWEAGRP